jgi:hypothetical protein
MKTLNVTSPVLYKGYTIELNREGVCSSTDFVLYPTAEGKQHDSEMDEDGYHYCGNCLWADSIEEAKELIDEKQN